MKKTRNNSYLKNKRRIVILICLVVLVIFEIVALRNSKASKVIEILADVEDETKELEVQEIDIEAVDSGASGYYIILPEYVNNKRVGNYVIEEKNIEEKTGKSQESNKDENELYSLINKEQQNIAKFLVENGADMILGNHASAVQKMEIMQNSEGKNVLVAYSLGNYISGETMDISKIELVLNIELRKNGETGEVVLSKVDYKPIYVLDNGTKAEDRYELIDMKETAKAYAEGNKKIVNKATYNKLVEGLKKLEGIIK